jgi:hypothetical protein
MISMYELAPNIRAAIDLMKPTGRLPPSAPIQPNGETHELLDRGHPLSRKTARITK